jgi:hypothetical protein
MSGSPALLTRVPIRPSPVGARRLAALALLFLLAAVIKPWGSPSSPAPLAGTVADVGASAARPSPAASTIPAAPSVGPGQLVCAPSGWDVVSIDRIADWTVRTWVPAVPVAAGGPSDPSIPTIRLESPEVVSVGVCGPSHPAADGMAEATLVVAAWQLGHGAPRGFDVATVEAVGLDARLARLYAPTPAISGRPAWPPGRYVLELAPLAGTRATVGTDGTPPRWFIAVSVPGPPA